MNAPLPTEELLKLARFHVLDERNAGAEAKERLLGQMADEIERLDREREGWASVAATRNVNIALIAEERDRLRTALRWCLKDSYWLHEASCFDSDEPKPPGVLETLDAERAALLRPAPDVGARTHDSSCVIYYGKPCDCGSSSRNREP